MREAVLFLCHLVNDEMLWRYAKLKEDLSGLCYEETKIKESVCYW